MFEAVSKAWQEAELGTGLTGRHGSEAEGRTRGHLAHAR